MNGNFEYYPLERGFYFVPGSKTDNRMGGRDNYFRPNSRVAFRRNRWRYQCREHPKNRPTRTRWHAAAPSVEVNYRPFVPKLPDNKIPNFSSAISNRDFVFRNFSAVPALAPKRQSPVSKTVRPRLKSDDDVKYLYTVQTKGNELIEVVDLLDDPEDPSSDLSTISSRLSPNGKSSDVSTISKAPEKVISSTKEQCAAHKKGTKRKKSLEDLSCDVCGGDYEFIRIRGEEMFRARCGHTFCQLCLKKLNPYKCSECNLSLHKLFKVFL